MRLEQDDIGTTGSSTRHDQSRGSGGHMVLVARPGTVVSQTGVFDW